MHTAHGRPQASVTRSPFPGAVLGSAQGVRPNSAQRVTAVSVEANQSYGPRKRSPLK